MVYKIEKTEQVLEQEIEEEAHQVEQYFFHSILQYLENCHRGFYGHMDAPPVTNDMVNGIFPRINEHVSRLANADYLKPVIDAIENAMMILLFNIAKLTIVELGVWNISLANDIEHTYIKSTT